MSVSVDKIFDDIFQSTHYCVFVDHAWANRQSNKYTTKLRNSAQAKNFFELEAKHLTEEGLLSSLAQFKVILDDQSAYRRATDFLEKKESGVLLFHNSQFLSSDLSHLVSRIIRFSQRKNLGWKFMFFGQAKQIDSSIVDQLFIEKFYPEKVIQPAKIKKPLAVLTSLICIAILTLVFVVKPSQDKPFTPVAATDSSSELTTTDLIQNAPSNIDPAVSQHNSLTEPAVQSSELLDLIRKSEQRDLEFKGLLAEINSQENLPSEVSSNEGIQVSKVAVPQTKITKRVAILTDIVEQAIRNNELTIVQESLVSNDLRLSENERGETPLIIAATNGSQQIAEWLLNQNVSVNTKDRYGRTAIFYAAINGDDVLLQRLLDSGARAGLRSNLSKTPLMAAVNNKHFSSAQMLLAYDVDIDVVDHSGWSAVFYAVWNSDINMLQLLIDKGASTTITDNSGLSLKQIAEARGNVEVINLL